MTAPPEPEPEPDDDAEAPRVRRREGEVLAAAAEVFWEKGYRAATIQDVAEKVGVLKGSLYHYIDSKEDLLERVFEDINSGAREILTDVEAADLPPLEALRTFFERYMLWYLTSHERVSLYFSEWRNLTGPRRAKTLTDRTEYELFVRALIADAQRSGDVSPSIDVLHASYFLLGACNSAATWYRRDGRDSPERIAASYAAMAIGLLVGTREFE